MISFKTYIEFLQADIPHKVGPVQVGQVVYKNALQCCQAHEECDQIRTDDDQQCLDCLLDYNDCECDTELTDEDIYWLEFGSTHIEY